MPHQRHTGDSNDLHITIQAIAILLKTPVFVGDGLHPRGILTWLKRRWQVILDGFQMFVGFGQFAGKYEKRSCAYYVAAPRIKRKMQEVKAVRWSNFCIDHL